MKRINFLNWKFNYHIYSQELCHCTTTMTEFFTNVKYIMIGNLSLQKGLKNVFDEAILAALEPPEPVKRRKCVLL